ncbi:MAG: DUF3662 domain-containing protein [Chloroherpetonaceae bacterium]|nr:DUF3662 domain-containing protein [Chthonomonadaceae bacterium]MDW8206666.1 DUF3662 domain-containing protein [Chloroherpetonaceae bacterium]
MDLLEKINRAFGTWYEGLFGGTDDVRPRDILRRILTAMEDHRKEGFDNRTYVPNQYILEIAVDDEEEKEYLLAFLDRAELETAIRRYCQQNHYHIRGELNFIIRECEDAGTRGRGEKIRVRCRYSTRVSASDSPQAPPASLPERPTSLPPEERTVASVHAQETSDEGATVPAVPLATLVVHPPGQPPYHYTITRRAVNIGRSARADNDLILSHDGQVSKRHARIELDPDGHFTLYDLHSTNGTQVNGRRIDNRTLHDGDEILLGNTRILFYRGARNVLPLSGQDAWSAPAVRSRGTYGGAAAVQEVEGSSSPPKRLLRVRSSRLILLQGDQEADEYPLASETLIGRAVTSDIVLPDRSVATRHARVLCGEAGYQLEALTADSVTAVNDLPVPAGQIVALKHGDRIALGDLKLRFVDGEAE